MARDDTPEQTHRREVGADDDGDEGAEVDGRVVDIDDDIDDGDEGDADPDEVEEGRRPPSRILMGALAAVVAAALVLTGGALAVITGVGDGGSSDPATPGEGSVDVGFNRDMMRHHRQAVEMAGWVRDRSQDPTIRTLAYDIETTQLTQVGQMQGLLLSWGVSENASGPPMQWMSDQGGHRHQPVDGALMPGMATQAELDHMKSLQGAELDIYFLQLMLRHHQGGLPMAQDAVQNAGTSAVRTLAEGMANAQANEIVLMEQMLRDRGAAPLPPP